MTTTGVGATDIVDSQVEKAVPLAYSNAVAKFSASDSVIQHTNRCKTVINHFCSAVSKPELFHLRSFNIDSTHTWAEVRELADEAAESYVKQGGTWRHPFRSSGRFMSNNCTALEALVGFIPNDLMTCALCGAMKMVYSAAKAMKSVRVLVFKTLHGLSESVESSSAFLRYYRQDEELRLKAEDLYVTILQSVEYLIDWFDHKAYLEVLKSVLQGSKYKEAMREKLTSDLCEKATRFKDRAQICLHARTFETFSHVTDIKDSVSSIDSRFQQNMAMLTSFRHFFEGLAENVDWHIQHSIARHASIPSLVIMNQPLISVGDLAQYLRVDPNTIDQDLKHIMAQGFTLDSQQQGCVAYLMQEPNFQAWFRSPSSRTLVVDGNRTETDQESSPLSYFCALLYQMTLKLPHTRPCIPLPFFCSQHQWSHDHLEGPYGIIRSLIYHLLAAQSYQIDLSFMNYQFLEQVRSFDLTALCTLFRNLILTLSHVTIIILIDSLSLFESELRSEVMNPLMRFLRDLTLDRDITSRGIIVKMLATSTGSSYYAYSWATDQERLALPEDNGDYVDEMYDFCDNPP